MKKFMENVLAFLSIGLFSLFVVYALVYALMYAWDFEAELQEQKEIEYMRERGLK